MLNQVLASLVMLGACSVLMMILTSNYIKPPRPLAPAWPSIPSSLGSHAVADGPGNARRRNRTAANVWESEGGGVRHLHDAAAPEEPQRG
jgi:hypothetical protein